MPKIPVDDCPAGPALNAAVAQVLGYEVLGIVPCYPDPFVPIIPYDGIVDEYAIERPVYLAHCNCDLREDGDFDYFGHIAGCLEVVADYSSGDGAAALKLKKGYWAFELFYFDTAELEVCWYAKFLTYDYVGSAYGNTASLAISRAFLIVNKIEEIEADISLAD